MHLTEPHQMFEINTQRSFTAEQDYSSFSVVRVHSRILKELGGRNAWVKISNNENCIYRIALGARSSTGFTTKSIEIDYDSHLELGQSSDFQSKCENGFYPCALKIQKAGCFGKVLAHWKHPDPGYRVPMQLGILGFLLGFIGLVLGIMGYA